MTPHLLLVLALSLAAPVCLPPSQEVMDPPGQAVATALLDQGGSVLHYQASSPAGGPADQVTLQSAARILRARLSDQKDCVVRIVQREGAGVLQVVLAGRDAGEAEALRGRLERPGQFALRLVATEDGPVDFRTATEAVQDALLHRAAGESEGPLPLAATEGSVEYRWVPTTAAKESGWTQHAAIARSTDGSAYVLVEQDPAHDFGERHLASVQLGVDHRGEPSLDIEFEASAAPAIREFTAAHQQRALGLLIDGVLVQAPTLMAEVSQRAVISSGSSGFDHLDVGELAAVLGASAQHGALPCALSLVGMVIIP